MFKNYLKIAFRNLIRHKGYSFINITGLAIGIATCLLILLYVTDELSYDRYNEKADQIYRVCIHGIVGTNEFNQAVTSAPMAKALVNDYPEVIAATRFVNLGFPVLRYKDRVFSEERFFSADSNIFDVFTIPFLEGDPKTALTQPNTIVITQSMARKYFGDEDPMGKVLNSDNRRDYQVTGVVKNVPHNSHFHFDFLASLSTYENSRSDQWLNNGYYTYILLQKDFPPEQLEEKFPQMVRKYVGPQVQQILGVSLDQMIASGNQYRFFLQPLTDIHLRSHLDFEIEPNGNATYVIIFSVIALGILLIACINFMNLATARSANRAREVGIRKTLGSNRAQLVRQFLAETIFMSFIAVFFALIFVELLLPAFNQIADKQVTIHYFTNIYVLPALIGLAVLVGSDFPVHHLGYSYYRHFYCLQPDAIYSE
ncbi:MAG: ABC transporter permease [Calditrichia bacterium]